MKNVLRMAAALSLALLGACAPQAAKERQIAVFVPGVLAGSPTYEMMDAGVRAAAAAAEGVTVKTVEAGFNQAEWADQLTALAASGLYEFIVTSNPAMPEIADAVSVNFPAQKFICLEASGTGNPNIAAYLYNHRELAWMLGAYGARYAAEVARGAPKLAILAGQEYPAMNLAIRPGFEEGVKAQFPQGSVEFRVLGNWYDAAKAAELAKSLFDTGVEVILPIAGSANEGVIAAARERGKKVLWYDNDGYALAEGLIVGSGVIRQDRIAEQLTKDALEGRLVWGTTQQGGLKEGSVDFLDASPAFETLAPEALRGQVSAWRAEFVSGTRSLPMP